VVGHRGLPAHRCGAGEIVADLLPVPRPLAELAIYGLSAGVVFFGLRAVGVAERLGALVLFALAGIIVVGSLGATTRFAAGSSGTAAEWLALYAMVMYAYWTFYSVPQVVAGLGDDQPAAVRAILVGLGLNGLLTAIVAVIALGVSATVTEVAIIGIADAIGSWVGTVGSLFIVAALITSYWSVSLALADILRERTGIPARGAWLAATLPSLLLVWLVAGEFLEFLRVAAGATALVVALIVVPMYLEARRSGPVREPAWSLGRLGSPAVLALVLLALVLMAAGSLLEL
jgi:hypothetical protein